MTPVETIKAAIVAELLRQYTDAMGATTVRDESLGHLRQLSERWMQIDGEVDLDALAQAVAAAMPTASELR